MSETLSEAAGCALLARLFRERGYAVRRNVPFREYGVSFDIDGWDPAARVGFEFLSSERADHQDLSLAEFERLKDAELRGELSLFIIDEVEPLSSVALSRAAGEFLDEVERRGTAGLGVRGGRVRRAAPPAGPAVTPRGRTPRSPAKPNPAPARPAGKKLAAKKAVAKKAVAKKAVAKKAVAKKRSAKQLAVKKPTARQASKRG